MRIALTLLRAAIKACNHGHKVAVVSSIYGGWLLDSRLARLK